MGPAAPPRPSGGSEEKRSGGGGRPAARGGASESDAGEEKKDPEEFLKPHNVTPVSKKNDSPYRTMRKRSHASPSPRKNTLGLNPKTPSPSRSSPRKEQLSSSFHFSPSQLFTTPGAQRRSWCRSSLKGTKHRRSLPPVHRDVTELSKSISLDLPETDRLSLLLLSSFQFSAQKLECILKETDGFSPEAFEANVHSVSAELQRYVQKLKRDGTLRSCLEDPKGISLDDSLDEAVAQIKEHITRFTAECSSWDQLLGRYQESAEEMARALEERRRGGGGKGEEPLPSLPTSQAHVLSTKPNYQQILAEQGEVWSCMELVLDELHQAVKLLQAFSEDSQHYLQRLSGQLATRTFRQLENSPVRKLIAAPLRRTLPPEG
ncbi:kinetochore-associated protein DSN1 homolog [Podargus strigoides]